MCFMKPAVADATTEVLGGEISRLKRLAWSKSGVSADQAARDLDLHENVLRKRVRELTTDPKCRRTRHAQAG